MRLSCITFMFVCVVSGDVNVFQWNMDWFLSRRVKFDSGFNVMVVYEVSSHGPEIISCFTGIGIWVLRWWRWRPFWFSMKISWTFSSNWVVPYQGRCSQFLIPSDKFCSSICDWKYAFSIFGWKYYFLCIEPFRVDFRCVHRFQLLNGRNHNVTLRNSHRVQSVSKEQSR